MAIIRKNLETLSVEELLDELIMASQAAGKLSMINPSAASSSFYDMLYQEVLEDIPILAEYVREIKGCLLAKHII